jgi:hypothetical protein
MRTAFHVVYGSLQLECDVGEPMTELIVTKIIALAKASEHDVQGGGKRRGVAKWSRARIIAGLSGNRRRMSSSYHAASHLGRSDRLIRVTISSHASFSLLL